MAKRNLSGDAGIPTYEDVVLRGRQPLVPEAIDTAFSTNHRMGTPEYSKAKADYLNSLSPQQLLSLKDFDISGLARSDLNTMSREDYYDGDTYEGYMLEGNLKYSPDELFHISKYRNVGKGFREERGVSGLKYLPDEAQHMTGDHISNYEKPLNTWSTRNAPGSDNYLYDYDDDGNFVPVTYDKPGLGSGFAGFMEGVKKSWIPIATAAVGIYGAQGGFGKFAAESVTTEGVTAGGGLSEASSTYGLGGDFLIAEGVPNSMTMPATTSASLGTSGFGTFDQGVPTMDIPAPAGIDAPVADKNPFIPTFAKQGINAITKGLLEEDELDFKLPEHAPELEEPERVTRSGFGVKLPSFGLLSYDRYNPSTVNYRS